MQFGNQKHHMYTIKIDDYTLPEVTQTKFLGVWIDNKLTWQLHLDQLCLKLIKNTQNGQKPSQHVYQKINILCTLL